MLTNLQEHNYLATRYEKSYSYLGLTIWERQNLRVLAQTQTWAIIHNYVLVHNWWRANMVQVSNCMSHTLHNSHPCIPVQLHFPFQPIQCISQTTSLYIFIDQVHVPPHWTEPIKLNDILVPNFCQHTNLSLKTLAIGCWYVSGVWHVEPFTSNNLTCWQCCSVNSSKSTFSNTVLLIEVLSDLHKIPKCEFTFSFPYQRLRVPISLSNSFAFFIKEFGFSVKYYEYSNNKLQAIKGHKPEWG